MDLLLTRLRDLVDFCSPERGSPRNIATEPIGAALTRAIEEIETLRKLVTATPKEVYLVVDVHTDERGDRHEVIVGVAADVIAAAEAVASGKLPILHDVALTRVQVLRSSTPASGA